MGIGKTMFNLACRYFCSNGVNRFFLYTDTDCNYRFYDAMRAERLGKCDTYALARSLACTSTHTILIAIIISNNNLYSLTKFNDIVFSFIN